MSCSTFLDREQAGWMLVTRLRERGLPAPAVARPLVLAIPRGGVEVGAVLAHGLAGDLDVVLARKLRAPHQPELALGAVSEGRLPDGGPSITAFATTASPEAPSGAVEIRIAEIERARNGPCSPKPNGIPRSTSCVGQAGRVVGVQLEARVALIVEKVERGVAAQRGEHGGGDQGSRRVFSVWLRTPATSATSIPIERRMKTKAISQTAGKKSTPRISQLSVKPPTRWAMAPGAR